MAAGIPIFMSTITIFFLLLSSRTVKSQIPPPINEFCKTADEKVLCTSMVKGAKTWHDAVFNAIQSSLATADQLEKMLPKIEPELIRLPLISRKSTVESCKDNFDSAVDDLKEALDFLEANDKGSLNIHLSAVSVTDCIDSFEQFKTPFPSGIDKVVRQLDMQISVCLAVSQQI
ncbi:hypothetical protein LguiB_016226 [Lonicera macranthoides]